LEDAYPIPTLIGKTPAARAEARRLAFWFDLKFAREVTSNIVYEKMMKRFLGRGEPDSERIRVGKDNIRYHLEYIEFLTERRNWLAGDNLTCADLAAGAHLSVIDYLGDVPWDQHVEAKNWYARLKSRPSFQPLLTDHVAGVLPPKTYADLDF
jgi:glutathione S-transferase